MRTNGVEIVIEGDPNPALAAAIQQGLQQTLGRDQLRLISVRNGDGADEQPLVPGLTPEN